MAQERQEVLEREVARIGQQGCGERLHQEVEVLDGHWPCHVALQGEALTL